jgi:adenylate cyclase class 2
MSNHGQEIEAKFYLSHLDMMLTRLQNLQARLIQPRVLEINLRFDLPDGSLRSQGRVLRLRRDTESKLTYKGASQNTENVLGHDEIEFVVEDFEKARQFLEALGYRQILYYEKYRATYEFHDAHVMIDELPFGNFIEIEGENVEQIRGIATKLGLRWDTAIGTSYVALFENVQSALNLPFDKISFENFKDLAVTADHAGVRPADG